jgi:two-component system chemotaxis sensor kinase CheA
VVAAKALQAGLVSAEELARMNEREIFNLIFLPGFSTAATVTNVSGRGVGMDMVKSNLEKIGGAIDVSSVIGDGTSFHVRIPLTLAIIPALTVLCAGDRYAIPTVNLAQLVRLEGRQAQAGIERISGTPVCRLRGSLLPLIYLDRELGVAEPDPVERDTVQIVVLQAEDRRFGLVVDGVLDTKEIVVKPLGSQLQHVHMYAGATILGDGSVALILDVLALAQRAHLAGGGRDRQVAIPLEQVTRLEECPAASVEHVGGRELVQYGEEILPLVRLAGDPGSAKDLAELKDQGTPARWETDCVRARLPGEQVDLLHPLDRLATRGDAELAIDRERVGLHRILGHIQALAHLSKREVGGQ